MFFVYSDTEIQIPTNIEYACFVSHGGYYYAVFSSSFAPIDAVRIPLNVGMKIATRDDNEWITPSTSTEGVKLLKERLTTYLRSISGVMV